MIQRVAIIGGAVVLGALVLLVAFLAGGDPPPQQERNIRDAGNVDAPPFDLEAASERSLHDKLAGSGRGRATLPSDDGTQLTELHWASSARKPQGIWEVAMPGVRIHMEPYRRVLQVQALEGTFNLPDEQLRGGRLRRNVVLTLFDAQDGRVVDLSNDSPDIKLRLFLDEATFDLDLGMIESDSPVHATSARFDFRGAGLRLNYNAAKKQVDRLEILRGDQLRIAADTFETASPDATTSDAAPRQPRQPREPSSVAADANFYRATLDEDVKVVSADMAIDADELALIFALTSNAVSDEVFDEPQSTGDAPPSTTERSTPRTPAAPPHRTNESSFDSDIPAPPEPASLMPVAADDMTITWRGALIVAPQETPPAALTADDVQLQLWGAPVRIETRGDKPAAILAGSVNFVSSTGVFEAFQGLHQPVVISSPELGNVQTERMVVNQREGSAVLHGAGELRGRAGKDEPRAGDPPRLPPDMRIAWHDRLDLVFAPRDKADADPGPLHFTALRNATFHGNVAVRQDAFELDTDQLALRFGEMVDDEQGIEAIDALGNVRIFARGKRPQDELTMRSDALAIATQPDAAGRLQPATLTARGDVYAEQPEHKLWAGEVLVELDSEAGSDDADADNALPPVRRMTARHHVRVERAEQNVAITADLLIAIVDAGQVDLHGTEGKPVNLQTHDGLLVGNHITMVEPARTLEVHGPGRLYFALDERAEPQPNAPIAFVHDPQHLATIRWTEALRFDDARGEASFVGDVTVDARNGNDTTRSTSQRLDLMFAQVDDAPAPVAGTIVDTSEPMMRRMLGGERAIRQVIAQGDATLLSESWVDAPNQQLATRLRLAGPRIVFDHPTGQVNVVGAGSMLVQDERRKPSRAAAEADNAASPVAFTGQGATVFTWHGSLTLDAERNDMTIRDRVHMVHRPQGRQEKLQLDCATLVADLEETGGLNAWLSERGPQPGVVAIRADEHVQIVSNQYTITTDHLLYTGEDETVLLHAEEGGVTQVIQEGRPTPMTAKRFRWDLRRDAIRIDSPGPGRAPVQ